MSLMVPGHGANGKGLAAGQADFIGEQALRLDVTSLLQNIDLGPDSNRNRAERLAAQAWGARRSWFLTNGSSQGNRTAALAIAQFSPNILLQRNTHSSIIDGVILAGLTPAFVLPSVDVSNGIAHCVSPKDVEQALTAQDRAVGAVYIVSPSYFGAVADIKGIAEVVHRNGAALVVDCAWGPHFGFHPDLPESPLRLGADLMITSTHKLTTSLHQSALLHLAEGEHADRLEPLVERAIKMTSSTSESSLLIGSIDVARRDLQLGGDQIGSTLDILSDFRNVVRKDGRFPLIEDSFSDFTGIIAADPFRIPLEISATGTNGHDVRMRLLRDLNIWVEMATQTTIVPVVGAGKRPRLISLLEALDTLAPSTDAPAQAEITKHLPPAGPLRMLPRDAFLGDTEIVDAKDAVGRISADSLAAYPPGIPNVLPGEEIGSDVIAFLQEISASPLGSVRGAVEPGCSVFRVVRA